jgi:tetratricopeptide (TPR) repeat protein
MNAPLLPTEDTVQEWCLRLDELRQQNRISEISHIHNWLNVAFGRERADRPRPLDLRIHRRLGQCYLQAKSYAKAAEEFELGRRLAPRDIFILRGLGQAYLGSGDYEQAGKVLDRIGELDAQAFEHNVECATLKGRWHSDQQDFGAAREVYKAAFARNPQSYYLADLLGQTNLELGRLEEAKEAYANALRVIGQIAERNVWTFATAATAALVMGDEAAALRHLQAVRGERPTPENVNSIERGLRRIQTSLKRGEADFIKWQEALRA